ncbi:MAG: carbon starvation protein A [Candidatus Methanomethylophilaceae archaeon]|nr:carbon starvation protein A [Candidatus Methanomethylophilaceae archaeon]
MTILIIGLIALLLGYLFYSRFIESIVKPFRETTPAYTKQDGMDYVPMSKWKNQLIQLLNIAGTGPIFGALMGAKWGPIVFLWIIFGSILGGAVHDYMTGIMSVRNGGESTTGLITKYLGSWTKYPVLLLLILLMVMVAATFARSASDLLVDITGIPTVFWMVIIIAYFLASTLLPINKVIGRIYPVFGVLLIIMAVTVVAGLLFGDYTFPSMTLENLHPSGEPFFPDMFITVACGAVSGFHASQSPMVARCLEDERDGRMVFYGAMLLEAIIALIWASAGLAFYGNTGDLTIALNDGGSAGVVYDISTTVVGSVGGILAVIGVIVCPVTTGDTALRAARMMVQDSAGHGTRDVKISLLITLPLTAIIVLLTTLDFSVLWNYFSWMNQVLACIMLWAATVFLLKTARRKVYSLVTALPAMFMMMVTVSFILFSTQGLGLDYTLSMCIAAAVTFVTVFAYVREIIIVPAEPAEV